MPLALITGSPLASAHSRHLESLGYELVNGSDAALRRLGVAEDDLGRHLTEAELIAVIPDVAVYIYGGNEPASPAALEAARSLELIAFLGTGWHDPGCVDAVAAQRLGLRVTNTPHANAVSTAEMAVALSLALSRAILPMDRAARGERPRSIAGNDLSGKTVGIVGLGHVGTLVARALVRGFGMTALYTGPNRKPNLETELGIEYAPLSDLLGRADLVSIHSPAAATIGMIGDDLLGQMKTGALLVNTSAPEIVDGRALVTLLESDHIKAAAIDGFYSDQAIQDALNSMVEKTIVTPRAAWLTEDSTVRTISMAFESIADLRSGKDPLAHQVCPAPA